MPDFALSQCIFRVIGMYCADNYLFVRGRKCEVGERAGIVAWRRGDCPAGDCGMGKVKFVAA